MQIFIFQKKNTFYTFKVIIVIFLMFFGESVESVGESTAAGAIKGRAKHSVVNPLLWTTAMEVTQVGLAAFPLLM